jgi:hypothetical protein
MAEGGMRESSETVSLPPGASAAAGFKAFLKKMMPE